MTRKENLLIEIYNLRNQISEIKGNTLVNIDEFSQTRKFRDEAASWKEIELKLRIEIGRASCRERVSARV